MSPFDFLCAVLSASGRRLAGPCPVLLPALLLGLLVALTQPARAIETYTKVVTSLSTNQTEGDLSLLQADADIDGSVFVGASMRTSAQFAPGIEITPKLGPTAREPYDAVLARLDASGGWSWARRALVPIPVPGSGGEDFPTITTPLNPLTLRDLKVTSTNVYLVGSLRSNREIGFLSKLDKSGNVAWSRYLISDSTCSINAVEEGSDGSIYIAGRVQGAASLVGMQGTVVSRQNFANAGADWSAFVAKISAAGVILWSQTTTSGAGETEEAIALEIDGSDTLHVLLALRGNAITLRHANNATFQANLRTSGRPATYLGRISNSGFWGLGRFLGGTTELAVIPAGNASDIRGTDLRLLGGKVFVAGAYTSGTSRDQGFLLRLLMENHATDGSAAYFVSVGSPGTPAYPTRLHGSGRDLFVAGEMPPTLQVYGQRDPKESTVGTVYSEILSLRPSRFVASFDLSLKPNWLRTSSRADAVPVPRDLSGDMIAFDTASRRLYWGGDFRTQGNEKLLFGEPGSEVTLTASPPPKPTNSFRRAGWLTAFDAEGRPIRQVRLTVESALPPILINGTPMATSLFSETYLEGTTVAIAAAEKESNGTRHLITGYTLDTSAGTTAAKSLTLTMLTDTKVAFQWKTQHRLRIESDHATAGLINAAAAGNPVPLYGDQWVDHGSYADATVDGWVEPVDVADWGSRFIINSYTVSNSVVSTQLVTQVVDRLRVEELKANPMTRPVTILYSWKKQYRVSVQVGNPDASSIVLTRQITTTATNDSPGVGDKWLDAGTTVELLARANNTAPALTLKGWDYAAPVPDYFPITTAQQIESGFLTGSTIDGVFYYMRRIPSLTRSASIIWSYGELPYSTNVAIGVGFKFPNIVGKGTPPTTGWSGIRVLEGPPGSQGSDMMIWDPKNQVAIPTRPGVFLVDTIYGTVPNTNRVVLQVFSGFSGDRWQNDPTRTYLNGDGFRQHIAGTPPVRVDDSPNDKSFFHQFRYSTGDGAVVDGSFSASIRGRSVLVYSRLPEVQPGKATGDLTRENLFVRVVNTVPWSDVVTTSSTPAIIGSPLRSSFDTDNLGTGFVVHPVANYNAEIYDRENVSGPIIPVNSRVSTPSILSDRELIVVWYQRQDGGNWPYQPVHYPRFAWPAGNRIVIASRLGSEGLSTGLARQLRFDPDLFEDLRIYHQPDPEAAGYNPNEEHATVQPSLHAQQGGRSVPAAFALRNDLNISASLITASTGRIPTSAYTSDPYVLVQYREKASGQPRMAVYSVLRDDAGTRDPWVLELPGAATDTYEFKYAVAAGEPLSAPYPLNLAIGSQPCINSVSNLFTSAGAVPNGTYFEDVAGLARAWFIDHKKGSWAAAGDSAIRAYFSYPLADNYWYPFALDHNSISASAAGDCVPWLPKLNPTLGQLGVFDSDPADFRVRTEPVEVTYATRWPTRTPVLKVGETLTYAGGEYRADHPDEPGLPGVVGFAAAEVVFDSLNPFWRTSFVESTNTFNRFAARIIAPLEERLIAVPLADLPSGLASPASAHVTVQGDTWIFNQLPPSLQKRIFYRPLAKLTPDSAPGVLGLRGYVNDRTLGASDLTATPPPVYVLEPNVLTQAEAALLTGLGPDARRWSDHISRLLNLSRNPAGLLPASPSRTAWHVGLEPIGGDLTVAKPLRALGPGLALVPNPRLLDPAYTGGRTSYLTVAENNHPSLGDAPVTLHVIRVDPNERYRGALKVLPPVNVFDEKISLRHTADFGGNVDAVAFSWWSREEDGTTRPGDVPPGVAGSTPVWMPLGSATGTAGQVEIELSSSPALLLADQLFFARYRPDKPLVVESEWSQWAGSANSSIRDLDGDLRPDLRAQLAMGWVKRVLDAVNPYEARVREFGRADSPSTSASVLRQLGAPYVGPVALNAAKEVVENLGLIELYETVLRRARALSIDGSAGVTTPGINAALLLASTRLADFYTLLGREAWADALDPTLGYGAGATAAGSLDTTRFCFENQLPNLLAEELALLRGNDESLGRPVFNRLFWNFTKGEGEVAYALNYQIADVTSDGFLDENDAQRQYPMGHGDAWGHYLSAMRKRYDLLRAPGFSWDHRSEYYNLLDVVIGADFMDERQFARTAAARARAGDEIVALTFRSRYSEAPNSKLTGYSDADQDRAWGATEWARRAAQAALFDWAMVNSLLPLEDPDPTHSGIERIDRGSIPEISEIATRLSGIQSTLDDAVSGLNPLGLDPNLVPFDIDPTHIDVGSTAQIGQKPVQGLSHYEQIYERAFEAMRNASAALDFANRRKAQLREVELSAEQLRRQAAAQDLEYRNRLIEIFGTPYEGQIGAGKAYPAGYWGPDYNLFMYVDVNAITPATVPQANAVTYFDEYVSFHALTNNIPEEFRADLQEHFLDDISMEANTAVELLGDDRIRLRLPATAADYTFLAPESWGQRAAPGRLQALVGNMVQVQSDLALAVGDYDYLIKQLRDRVSLLKMRAEIDAEILGIKEEHYHTVIGLNTAIDALEALSAVFTHSAEIVSFIADGTMEGLPKVVGVANDITGPARLAIQLFTKVGSYTALRLSSLAADQSVNLLESSKEIVDLRDGLTIDRLEMSVELRGMLHEIEELLVNEGVTRIKLFALREQLRGVLDQYRATLQQGTRLIEERRSQQSLLAADTQSNRYHDLLLRSARHESIDRYRALFDLAQRYTYAAAKAYDYETNFDPRDRASARPILAEIVRARALGQVGETAPVAGPGLAGVLTRLNENFRAVEGRLGFNNLQLDTTSFSLRWEFARVTSNQAWSNLLHTARRANLWDVPEFRKYCRPFAPRDDARPQAGIVLSIPTSVIAGNNFFGHPLGAGDAAYDPSLYATKIRAAGVRFHDYPVESLARTPTVYLIPAGLDYMTIPNSPTLEPRPWNVVDQAIPVPKPTGSSDLLRESWLPSFDSLTGPLGEIRRFSSFRAAVTELDPDLNATRLIGRSVWNDGWLLIIPGQSLDADSGIGIDEFISKVTDITLTFETYGYSGN